MCADLAVQAIFTLVCFSFVLYLSVIPILWLYALGGTYMAVCVFAKQLAKYNALEMEQTAEFRGGLVRVRENAEAIAFYKAETHEEHWAQHRFNTLVGYLYSLIRYEAYVQGFAALMRRFAWVCPFIMLRRSNFGSIMQTLEAFEQVLEAFDELITQLSEAIHMAQHAQRVLEVQDAIDDKDYAEGRMPRSLTKKDDDYAKAPSCLTKTITTTSDRNLVIKDLTIAIPNTGHTIVDNLNFTLQPGTSLLVIGSSGVGKSSLLRAVCGLWKAQTGSISIPSENVMFLPQMPYIPEIPLESNTLKAQLTFPRVYQNINPAEIEMLLHDLNLSHLMTRGEGVLTTEDWRNLLSGGEKQRVALARLLLAKPAIAFLDEATSALDDPNERQIYKKLQASGAVYVSVGHNRELQRYHTHILEILPGGRWEFRSCDRFAG